MSEPKRDRTWRRIGIAKGGESGALMRIVEAVAIATTHTYTSGKYTALLKEFGTVEEDSKAFGCNRTGAMKDLIYDGQAVSSSAVQRVIHQLTLERKGGPLWTYETMPELVKSWLSEGGFD